MLFAELFDVFLFLRNPDATVVTERFGHERELRLLLAVNRNTGRVNLDEAGVGEECALLVRLNERGAVAVHRVGGEEVGVSITASGEYDGVRAVAFDFAGDEVADDDAARFTVDENDIEDFATVVGLNLAQLNHAVKRGVSSEKELLSGLTASIECTRDLGAAEGAVGEESAVVAREGDALGDALVDDEGADFSETVNVRFASAEIAALDRIVEETIDGVVVVLIVFRSVDTALRGDGVSATRTVGDAEDLDVIAKFREGRRGGRAAETSTDDDDIQLALVGRADDFHLSLEVGPFFGQRARRDFRLQLRIRHVFIFYVVRM